MARVTVEDCLVKMPNPFELALIASKRARQLARGAESVLPWENHKSTVLALREIAEGHVDHSVLAEEDLPAIQSPKVQIDSLDPLDTMDF